MERCLCCGDATIKKRRRLLTTKGDSFKVLLILRRYNDLVTELKNKTNGHQIFTAAEIKEESVVPEAYLCESCWKILITFYTKEVSIKDCIKKSFTILPTTEVNCESCDMTQSKHVSMSDPYHNH